ncbi:hypothetical protein ACVWYH_004830 [Bradyrhizobium sp. GM24.11]
MSADLPGPSTEGPSLLRLCDSDVIRVGRIWVPVRELPAALSRFTRLVFCLTESDEHPYCLRGSSTSLRWRDSRLSFYTQHQVAGFQLDKIAMPLDKDGKVLVSGSTHIKMMPTGQSIGEEFGDLGAMHFRPEDYPDFNLDRAFFELLDADLWRGDRDSAFIIYGYPTSLRNLELSEPAYALSHIRVKQVVTTARYVRPSNALGVHVVELEGQGEYSRDGLSGGPIFCLGQDTQGFFCGFAGIIMRGSEQSKLMHFLDARTMMQFMARIASE